MRPARTQELLELFDMFASESMSTSTCSAKLYCSNNYNIYYIKSIFVNILSSLVLLFNKSIEVNANISFFLHFPMTIFSGALSYFSNIYHRLIIRLYWSGFHLFNNADAKNRVTVLRSRSRSRTGIPRLLQVGTTLQVHAYACTHARTHARNVRITRVAHTGRFANYRHPWAEGMPNQPVV